MEFLSSIIDLFLHLDTHLAEVIAQYGTITYFILFLIIFCETGFVVTPFLPGDSLLFAAGAFAASGSFTLPTLLLLLFIAAVLGDTVNYWLGRRVGVKIFTRPSSLFFKREHLVQAEQFYEKHGGKAIILARFMPIVRTFAPFVAGVGSMNYRRFLIYNITGAALWVGGFVLIGYFFGNLPSVKDNFHYVILVIILLSFLPPIFHAIKAHIAKKNAPPDLPQP